MSKAGSARRTPEAEEATMAGKGWGPKGPESEVGEKVVVALREFCNISLTKAEEGE